MPRLSYRERLIQRLFRWHRRIHAKLHDLTYLAWQCTLRCNLACRHCSADCGGEPPHEDMPLADFLRVVDRVAEVGDPAQTMIGLTGGEPLLRPDLEACGTAFARRGFRWGIVTNGYVLSPDRFEALMDAGLTNLSISLDGLEESHNWLRRRPDSFQRTIAAVAVAAQRTDLDLDVITCVNQRNISELDDLRRPLIDKGVRKWRVETIFPKGRAEANPELDVTNEQFRDLMAFLKATRREGQINARYACEGYLGAYERQVRDRNYFCWAGINLGSVLVDGSISACPSLGREFIQGNIYEDDFIEVWNTRYEIMRDRRWTRTGKCAACEAYKWCEGNGLHLRDLRTGEVLRCHLGMLEDALPTRAPIPKRPVAIPGRHDPATADGISRG